MIYTVTEESGTKGLEQLAGSSSTGTPLGTWASFENDYAPNIEWLQGGTTFNPNTYPALAMYLGGNTVPERYDHDRLSDYEDITLSQDSNNPTIMAYDGFLYILPQADNTIHLYINGVEWNINHRHVYVKGNFTIPINKGDSIWYTWDNRGIEYSRVFYYKHPLFIKATPTSADSDYEGTLNAIREFYVRNNTYSTEERLTGGVWIDGKPIYRKAVLINITINGNWGNTNIPNPYYTGYTGDIERIITCTCTDGQATSLQVDMSPTYQFFRVAAGYGKLGTWTGVYLLLEYTKSTDS